MRIYSLKKFHFRIYSNLNQNACSKTRVNVIIKIYIIQITQKFRVKIVYALYPPICYFFMTKKSVIKSGFVIKSDEK